MRVGSWWVHECPRGLRVFNGRTRSAAGFQGAVKADDTPSRAGVMATDALTLASRLHYPS